MMNSGSTTRASSVIRHSSASIVPSDTTSTTTLLTTLPSVLVTAVCAPTTSLLRRLVIAPVGVRVKKATGRRCTLANRARRRSAMSPSPTRALHQRCPIWSAASAIAATTATPVSHQIAERSSSGIAWSMIWRTTRGGTTPSSAATRMNDRNSPIVPRYGRAKLQTRRALARPILVPFTASTSLGIM